MSPSITTYTGKTVNPLDPNFVDVCIGDIAHALSHQCRFTGHSMFFYSVAEHSVRVAECLARDAYSNGIVLWGLLHDASEAYLVDLPTPLKRNAPIGPAYREVEARVMERICLRFSLPREEPPSVRSADAILLSTEIRDLMPVNDVYWGSAREVKPLPERIRPWAADVAKYEFLRLYRQLTGDERGSHG